MTLLFPFPGNEHLADRMACEKGAASFHRYPDGETSIRIISEVKGRDVVLLCSLNKPDDKAMELMFFSRTAREFGAKSVRLIAPYLGYMRHDKRFQEGEAITSNLFADFLSDLFDGIVTIDPHLHRHKTMSEFYKNYAVAIHAEKKIVDWISTNIRNPVLIGPDEESAQWIINAANQNQWPYVVLKKTRYGDDDVKISAEGLSLYKDYTPVLIDDIISTGQTMIKTVKHILAAGMIAPVCIGIHAVFAGTAYEDLKASGTGQIVTTNTIQHPSNAIDISDLLSAGHLTLLQELA